MSETNKRGEDMEDGSMYNYIPPEIVKFFFFFQHRSIHPRVELGV